MIDRETEMQTDIIMTGDRFSSFSQLEA